MAGKSADYAVIMHETQQAYKIGAWPDVFTLRIPMTNLRRETPNKQECSRSYKAQRKTASLKVFRCGPRRNVGGHVVAARVDKPRKEEAAGFRDQSMGKVR